MARAVFLYFEDNEAAETFTEAMTQQVDMPPIPFGSKLIGLYGVPTLFCECSGTTSERSDKRIKRGQKLGWWVHDMCGKPVKGSYQSPRNLMDPKWDPREDTVVMFNYTVALKHHMGMRPDV